MSEIKKSLKKFDVDAALDSIDLSFNGYIPSEDSLKFFNIIRLVQGKDFEFNTPLVHYWIVDLLLGNISRAQYPYGEEVNRNITINNKRIAIMMSRGLAKSSIVTCFWPVYCSIVGEVPDLGLVHFGVGIAASAQGGGRVIAKSIQSLCEDSKFCKEYFEDMRFTETESEFTRKGTGSKDDRTFLFRTMGFSGGIRGTRSNVGSHRPDFLVFDDTILNTQAAYSETMMHTLKETIDSDAINALKGGNKGKIFHVFTPFHSNDPNYRMLTEGAYTPVAIPICEKVYEGMPKEEFVGAWPDMHPYEAVIEQYNQAVASSSTKSFNQERMLRISSDEDRMIPEELIEWYSRKVLLKELHAYNIYITTDFTTTSEAKSDFSAISAWAVNSNRDYYLVDLCVKRQSIAEQYDELFRMVGFWTSHGKPVEVGIEIDGQQKAHLFSLKEMMVKRSEWFQFARQKGTKYGSVGILSRNSGGSKHERFRFMLPQFQNHKMHFPLELQDTPDMKEALLQIKYTTWESFGGKDDFIDTVSQLGMIEIRYPNVPSNNGITTDREGSIWRDIHREDDSSAYSSYA